jgi:hypothetical protein
MPVYREECWQMGRRRWENCFARLVVCHYLGQKTELERKEEMLRRQAFEVFYVCSEIQMD